MKRFTIVQNGYNVEEVNRSIDIVIKRLEKLNNDNSPRAHTDFLLVRYNNINLSPYIQR